MARRKNRLVAKKKNIQKSKTTELVVPRVPMSQSSLPVTKASRRGTYMQMVGSPGQDSIRVRGCDLFTETRQSESYSEDDWILNPLVSSLFPKLSAIASIYEKWRPGPTGISIHYDPICSVNTAGVVGMMVDTDVSDTGPTSMSSLAQNRIASVGPAWDHRSINYRPQVDQLKWYFTSSSANAERLDQVGKLYIATSEGGSGTALTGFVYIEYDIEFCIFRPPTQTGMAGFLMSGNVAVPPSGGTVVEMGSSGPSLSYVCKVTGSPSGFTDTKAPTDYHSTSAPPQNAVYAVGDGQQMYSSFITAAAAATTDEKFVMCSPRVALPKPQLKRQVAFTDEKSSSVETPGPASVIEFKDGVPCFLDSSGGWTPCPTVEQFELSKGPSVANDVSVQIILRSLVTGIESVLGTGIVNGSGIVSLATSVLLNSGASALYAVFTRVFSDGSQARTLTNWIFSRTPNRNDSTGG